MPVEQVGVAREVDRRASRRSRTRAPATCRPSGPREASCSASDGADDDAADARLLAHVELDHPLEAAPSQQPPRAARQHDR